MGDIDDTTVAGRRVSTLREDRGSGQELPGGSFSRGVFFETMHFGGTHNCTMRRTRSELEGRRNHAEGVRDAKRWNRAYLVGERVGSGLTRALLRVVDSDMLAEFLGGLYGASRKLTDKTTRWKEA